MCIYYVCVIDDLGDDALLISINLRGVSGFSNFPFLFIFFFSLFESFGKFLISHSVRIMSIGLEFQFLLYDLIWLAVEKWKEKKRNVQKNFQF